MSTAPQSDPNAPGGEFHTEVADVLRTVAGLYRPGGLYRIDGERLAQRLEEGSYLVATPERDTHDLVSALAGAAVALRDGAGRGELPPALSEALVNMGSGVVAQVSAFMRLVVTDQEVLGYLSMKALPVSDLSARADAVVRRLGGTPVDHTLYDVPVPSGTKPSGR